MRILLAVREPHGLVGMVREHGMDAGEHGGSRPPGGDVVQGGRQAPLHGQEQAAATSLPVLAGERQAGLLLSRWCSWKRQAAHPRSLQQASSPAAGREVRPAEGRPQHLALRDEIALLGTRLTELLDDLGDGGDWSVVRQAMADMDVAIAHGDDAKMLKAMDAVRREAQAGTEHQRVWAEVYDVANRRRLLSETETRRLVQARQVVTLEEMLALLALVQDVVVRHVADPSARARIADELRLAAGGQALPVGAGGAC